MFPEGFENAQLLNPDPDIHARLRQNQRSEIEIFVKSFYHRLRQNIKIVWRGYPKSRLCPAELE